MNPLIPSASDVVLAIAVTVHLVLMIVALIQLARTAGKKSWFGTVVFIVLVPVIGPIVSMMATRRDRHVARRREAPSPS